MYVILYLLGVRKKKKKIINKLVLLGTFTEWDKSYSLKQGNFRKL